jgi:hypothetical protein
MSLHRSRLISMAALVLVGACSSSPPFHTMSGAGGTGLPGGNAGNSGNAGTTGAAGDPSGAAGNDTSAAGSSGAAGQDQTTGTGGAGVAGAGGTPGGSGSAGAGAGATGTAGASGDPLPPHPLNVQAGGVFQQSFNGQSMFINTDKPAVGKLVLLLGGICTGTGAGGFESFVKEYGFHVFAPKTDTCLDGGKVPQMYKDTLKTDPTNAVANHQIGDSRMELWDGKDRVSWYSVAAGASIQEETIAALKYGDGIDPGADWTYYLNADGTLRTTDVWVVGYSWGSQTWAMISSYVRFGRVITTSGPQDEGFPNAAWITDPSATPGDRKYILVGFQSAYPSTNNNDSEVMSMFTTVTKAGWVGTPTNVLPNGMGTYMSTQHLFAMVGNNGDSPGGHTVFCNDDAKNGWLPLCKYVLNVQ